MFGFVVHLEIGTTLYSSVNYYISFEVAQIDARCDVRVIIKRLCSWILVFPLILQIYDCKD